MVTPPILGLYVPCSGEANIYRNATWCLYNELHKYTYSLATLCLNGSLSWMLSWGICQQITSYYPTTLFVFLGRFVRIQLISSGYVLFLTWRLSSFFFLSYQVEFSINWHGEVPIERLHHAGRRKPCTVYTY